MTVQRILGGGIYPANVTLSNSLDHPIGASSTIVHDDGGSPGFPPGGGGAPINPVAYRILGAAPFPLSVANLIAAQHITVAPVLLNEVQGTIVPVGPTLGKWLIGPQKKKRLAAMRRRGRARFVPISGAAPPPAGTWMPAPLERRKKPKPKRRIRILRTLWITGTPASPPGPPPHHGGGGGGGNGNGNGGDNGKGKKKNAIGEVFDNSGHLLKRKRKRQRTIPITGTPAPGSAGFPLKGTPVRKRKAKKRIRPLRRIPIAALIKRGRRRVFFID